jgi:hypothetical protein
MDQDNPKLVIELNQETNQVTVAGPIQNRLLAYAMLKLAEKAIDENYQKAMEQAIVPARENGQRFLKRY